MKIPTSFKIGGRTWKVLFKDTIDEGLSFAKWFDYSAEIHIARNVVCDEVMKPCDEYTIEHSFWHELGHVMQYYSTCATDETSVQTFASFMMEFNNSKITE